MKDADGQPENGQCMAVEYKCNTCAYKSITLDICVECRNNIVWYGYGQCPMPVTCGEYTKDYCTSRQQARNVLCPHGLNKHHWICDHNTNGVEHE